MSKTKYAVTHPDGTVSTRTSANPYTHAVEIAEIMNGDELIQAAAVNLAGFQKWAETDELNAKYYAGKVQEATSRLTDLADKVGQTWTRYYVIRWSSSAAKAAPEARKPYWSTAPHTARVVEVDR